MPARFEVKKGPQKIDSLQPHSIQQIRQMAEVDLLSAQELEERKIINPSTQNKAFLNTFREIRTKMIQSSSKKNFVAMVSSVVHGGGATFIAVNLAAAFALDQSKTALFIDCNLYEPSLDKLFNIAPDPLTALAGLQLEGDE